MYVLEFLNKNEIEEFIDETGYKVIEYLLRKTAFSQPEVRDESELSGIQITKEFLEDWIAQAGDLKKIGAGSYPIDVYKENEYGCDIDGNITPKLSNETSLSQNFKTVGSSLDTLFLNEEHENILNLWSTLLYEKIQKPIRDLNLKKIYYFVFMRANNKIFLSIALLNPDLIMETTVSRFSKTSVYSNGYIDERYGRVNVYKSKKRMELRLFTHHLIEDNKTILWDFDNFYPDVLSLRTEIKKNGIKKQALRQFKKYFG